MSVLSVPRLSRMAALLAATTATALLAPGPVSVAAESTPTITAPTNGATVVSSPMLVSADSGAAFVRFVVAGQVEQTVAVSGGTAITEIPVHGLLGSTSIEAYDCDSLVSCSVTSASVTVNVDLKAPVIISPALNDVVGDSATIVVRTVWGGALRFFVDGSPAGKVLGSTSRLTKDVSLRDRTDGDHVLSVQQCNTDGSICDGRTDEVSVIKDTKGPRWSDLSTSNRTVFPVKDRYQDATVLSARVGEKSWETKVEIRKAGGPLVRTIKLGRVDPGLVRAIWNGRKSNGDIVPKGKYLFRFVGTDTHGIIGRSPDRAVFVSGQQLVKQTVTTTVSAKGSFFRNLAGDCSGVYALDYPEARYDWPKGVGYYSRSKCNGSGTDDTALALHRAAAPKAVRYGSMRIDTYGGGAFRHAGPGVIVYVKADGDAGAARVTKQNLSWHSGPSTGAGSYVRNGRVTWAFGTTRGNWYDVKEFRLTFRVSVLR